MNTKNLLTTKQLRVYNWIASYIAERGISPTRQEVADEFSMYVNAAETFIQILERKGYLYRVRLPGKKVHRNIVIGGRAV